MLHAEPLYSQGFKASQLCSMNICWRDAFATNSLQSAAVHYACIPSAHRLRYNFKLNKLYHLCIFMAVGSTASFV
jgi:hypothetical protein